MVYQLSFDEMSDLIRRRSSRPAMSPKYGYIPHDALGYDQNGVQHMILEMIDIDGCQLTPRKPFLHLNGLNRHARLDMLLREPLRGHVHRGQWKETRNEWPARANDWRRFVLINLLLRHEWRIHVRMCRRYSRPRHGIDAHTGIGLAWWRSKHRLGRRNK